MNRKFYINFFFCFLVFVLFFPLSAPLAVGSDLTSTNFIVRDPVIGVGSGYGSSTSFELHASQGLTLTGVSSSASFLSHYGFLYFTDTSSSNSGGGSSVTSGGGVSRVCRIADLNCDGSVNIMDLSILLYYSEHSGLPFAQYDLNKDGQLDLSDISILFYYWYP